MATWSLYPYDPNKPLPIVFAVIILALGVINAWQNWFKYRWRYFGFIMTWASIIWAAAFIMRAISTHETQNIPVFIAQYCLILSGPPAYAAAETFILGRLMAYMPYNAPIHPGRVVSTFVLLSTAVEVMTINGATRNGIGQNDASDAKIGDQLVEAALILQSLIEVFFFGLTAYFHIKSRRMMRIPSHVTLIFGVLYLTSSMVFVRCIVRVVEKFGMASCNPNAPGYDGYCGVIARHEWFLWVFETANITFFVIILTIFTPGRYLPHSYRVYLDPHDAMTERLGPGFSNADKRPILATIFDPFNVVGIVTGRGHVVEPFWEVAHPEYVGQDGVVDTRPFKPYSRAGVGVAESKLEGAAV